MPFMNVFVDERSRSWRTFFAATVPFPLPEEALIGRSTSRPDQVSRLSSTFLFYFFFLRSFF